MRNIKKKGHEVASIEDIRTLNLENVEKVVGYLGVKYKALATTTGCAEGASSFVPLAAIPATIASIPVFVGLALRAICEYATYYGYDTSLNCERVIAAQVLALSSAEDAAKKALILEINRFVSLAANKSPQLTQHFLWAMLKKMAEAFGKKIEDEAFAKFAGKIVPWLGMAIGAGVNAMMMTNICNTAFFEYRKRFLQDKGFMPRENVE